MVKHSHAQELFVHSIWANLVNFLAHGLHHVRSVSDLIHWVIV